MSKLRVLLIEDSQDDALLLLNALQEGGYQTDSLRVETADDFGAALIAESWDLILADYRLPHFSALAALEMFRVRSFDIPFIIVSGAVEEETAVGALKAGAHDFIRKDRPARLIPAIQRELRDAEVRRGRHRAELALQESQATFHAFMDHSPACAFIKDRSGRYVYMNETFRRQFGVGPDTLAGKTDFEWLPPAVATALRKNDEEVVRCGKPIEVVEMVPDPTVGMRAWLVQKFPILNETGGNYVGGIAIDITDRRQAEEKLAVLASIVESSDDAIISKDLEGRVRSWNRGAEQLFGYTADEMVGRSVRCLIPHDIQHEEDKILAQIREGERIVHYETVRRRKDGTLVDISLTISPLRDVAGTIIGASTIARNITERKRSEETLRRAHEELERRVEARTNELAKANAELQEKIVDLETFHDAVVGRELKMIDLEKEIARLRATLNPDQCL